MKPANNIKIRELPDEDFNRVFAHHSGLLRNSRLYYGLSSLLSPAEQADVASIQWQTRNTEHIYLGLFDRDRLVGWTCGFQTAPDTLYINNSVIFESHRGRGYHVALLNHLIKMAEKRKYRLITCHHYSTLSSLIAKKLDMGFYITAFELNDTHGVLVKMTFFLTNKEKQRFLRQATVKKTSP